MSHRARVELSTLGAFALAALAGVAGCGGSVESSPEDTATAEGRFVAYGGIALDGRKLERYALQSDDGREITLDFGTAPALASGTRLRVQGHAFDDRLRVQRFDVVQPARSGLGVSRQAATVQNGVTTRRAAILKVYWGTNDGRTNEEIRAGAFDGATSADGLFNESSFGKLRFQGDVFDWLQIPNPGDCGSIGWIASLAQQAASAAGIDLTGYDHLSYYVGEQSDPTCWWAGFGEVGTPAFPAQQTWYHASWSAYVFAHEWGHNLGNWHAHSYSCGSPIAPQQRCELTDEYGDVFEPMGLGNTQFGAYHKAAQGWFTGCNLVTTPRTGVFTLSPIESSTTGVQAVRLPLSPALCPVPGSTQGCFYYLESRRPIGAFDGAEPYASSPMKDGILIHADVGFDPTGQSGLTGPYLLDMTPNVADENGQFWNASLVPNRAFGDSTGVRIRVLSQTSNSVRVAIKVPGGSGAPTCMDGSTFALPASCSNGTKNTGETDVDCGGTTCVPCDEGKTCSLARDCWSGSCVSGKCRSSCNDGMPDGNETDVDCGGSCAQCRDGLSCTTNADCASGFCNGGRCMQHNLLATMNVNSIWDTGYCATIDLNNVASTPTSDWSVELDFTDSYFYQTSGAEFAHKIGNIYRLTPEDWNRVIYPSSHSTISFCGYRFGPDYSPEITFVTAQY